MKHILRTTAALILLVIALVLFVDLAVERSVEEAAEAALEVDAELGNATLGTLSGRIGLDSLTIDNPPNFSAPHFLTIARAEVDLAWTALVRDQVEVPELVLDTLELELEHGGEKDANYAELLDHLVDRAAAAAGEGGAKRFVVGRVIVRDLRVRIRHDVTQSGVRETAWVLSEVVLREAHGAGTARPLPQQVATVVSGLLEAVLRTRPEELPASLLADLERRLRALPERVAVEVTLE